MSEDTPRPSHQSHIRIASKPEGGYLVEVDGHDIARHAQALILNIGIKEGDYRFSATVTLTMRADVLDVDLPALLDIAREEV